MGSRFPLLGLRQKVSVIRLTQSDDGFGGVAEVESVLVPSLRCRISLLTREIAERIGYGDAIEKKWQVLCVVNHDLTVGTDRIRVPAKMYPNLKSGVTAAQDYDIVFVSPQQDDTGQSHHMTVIMELRDG